MENTKTPTGLIFSRQNIANLPEGNDYEQAAKGAYIVAGSDRKSECNPRCFRLGSCHIGSRR